MAAKPTQDPKWVTSDDPNEIIEPSPALKTNGIQSGGIWGREHLNWMFNSLSKWIDWVRSFAMDKDNNLNDVADKPSAFNNIKQNATTTFKGVVELATQTEVQNGVDLTRVVTPAGLNSRTATETRTGLVEKATEAEMKSGTSGKFPDSSTIHTVLPVASHATDGFWKCKKTGIMIQWFRGTSALDGSQTFSFPTEFPNACLGAGPLGIATNGVNFSRTSMTFDRLNTHDDNITVTMFAVGY